jgi:predicted O-methyltransferase YrrM
VNILIKYFKYLYKSKNRHGIHSPFVYTFVNECARIKVTEKFNLLRKNLFNQLKKDRSKIEITDFGAGSKKLSNVRTVSNIFTTSSSRGKYGLLLYKISNFYQPKNILELGTSLGIGSIHFSKGHEDSKITTLEACKNTFEKAKQNFKNLDISNIHPINQTFLSFLENLNDEKYDVVFIDGHHDGQALINYLNLLKNFTHNDTIFILDDIRWSDSMFKAWESIKNDNYYNLTIDLFRMGIISPRKQQEKEHFIIRI